MLSSIKDKKKIRLWSKYGYFETNCLVPDIGKFYSLFSFDFRKKKRKYLLLRWDEEELAVISRLRVTGRDAKSPYGPQNLVITKWLKPLQKQQSPKTTSAAGIWDLLNTKSTRAREKKISTTLKTANSNW